jgi:hypothetical protein
MKKRRIDLYKREAYLMAALSPAIIVIGLDTAWIVRAVSKAMHH